MKKHFQARLKVLYLAVNLILLALPVFIPSSKGVDSLINLCCVAMILLSFPLNILTNWVLFAAGYFSGSIGSLYFVMVVCAVVGYFQWFVVVPWLARILREKFFGRDLQINISANVQTARQLPEPPIEVSPQEWQKKWYDEQKRTPVERLFDDE